MVISYIETAASTTTRRKALKDQYIFNCMCIRCMKVVPSVLFVLQKCDDEIFALSYLLQMKVTLLDEASSSTFVLLQGQKDDIEESATLEGYKCRNENCDGYILQNSGKM